MIIMRLACHDSAAEGEKEAGKREFLINTAHFCTSIHKNILPYGKIRAQTKNGKIPQPVCMQILPISLYRIKDLLLNIIPLNSTDVNKIISGLAQKIELNRLLI